MNDRLIGEKVLPPSPRRLLYYGVLAAVLLAAFWPFADVLGYYFTKTDTGPLLRSARIQTPRDLLRILTHPVLDVSNPRSIYYRPTTTLSFSLDWALWGFRPFGYHLTDLVLHLAVAGLLFRVVYLFNGKDIGSAGLAGMLYGLHPVLVEVVPAVAHRQETLVAAFLLAGLWAFWSFEHGAGSHGSRAMAVGAFLLSLGAKEVGVLFLPIVLTHLFLVSPPRGSTLGSRLRETFQRGRPYLIAAGSYVAWWAYVTDLRAFLGGGHTFRTPLVQEYEMHRRLWTLPGRIVPQYVRALGYPLEMATGIPGPVEGRFEGSLPLILVTGLVGTLLVLLSVKLGVGNLLREVAGSLRSIAGGTGRGGSAAAGLYAVWLVLPMVFYAAVNVISYKHAYHGLLPLSALLGTLLAGSTKAFVSRLRPGCFPLSAESAVRVSISLVLVIFLGGWAAVLVSVSPLTVNYPAWHDSQLVNRIYHRALFEQLERLPSGSTIGLHATPLTLDPSRDFPHIIPSLRPDPWIPMHFPEHEFRVRRLGLKIVESCPCPLWLETRRMGPRSFLFVTHLHEHERPN